MVYVFSLRISVYQSVICSNISHSLLSCTRSCNVNQIWWVSEAFKIVLTCPVIMYLPILLSFIKWFYISDLVHRKFFSFLLKFNCPNIEVYLSVALS